MASWRARARPASGTIVTISTRIRQFDVVLRHRRALRQRLLLGRHASAQRARGTATFPLERDRAACAASQGRGRSARPGSTTTTSIRRPRRRRKASATTSRRRARPACRSKSTRAKLTRTRSPFSKTSTRRGAFPAVLHCFTGGRELALRAVDLGLYVSFCGVLTFKKSDALREIARDVPLDRLLVETDAPFLAPDPSAARRNEPAYVVRHGGGAGQGARASRRRRPRARHDRQFLPPLQPRRRARRGGSAPHEHARSRSWAAAPRAACRASATSGASAIRAIRRTAGGAARCWSSAFGKRGARRVLVDTSPDLREQLLAARVDAPRRRALHARPRRPHARHRRPAHGRLRHEAARRLLLRRARTREQSGARFDYCFDDAGGFQLSADPASHEIRLAGRRSPSTAAADRSRPCRLRRSTARSHRSAFASATSPTRPTSAASRQPRWRCCEGLDVWIVDALRYTPHPSHFSVKQALEWIERLAPSARS